MEQRITFTQLKKLARTLGIDTYGYDKYTIRKSIVDYLKKPKVGLFNYEKIRQIGNKGKDAIVYLTKKSKKYYAMKSFKKKVTTSNIKKEIEFQNIAFQSGIAPKIIDYNLSDKYIVMQKMDTHLVDYITKKNGILPKKHQIRLIEIFKKLDENKIFQTDPNILNYMIKNDKIYMIDYGMCKNIDKKLTKKLGTDKPNLKFTLLSFICKLKEGKCSPSSYKHLLNVTV